MGEQDVDRQDATVVVPQPAIAMVSRSYMGPNPAQRYPTERSWTELWQRLHRSIHKLHAMAGQTNVDKFEMVDELDSFFMACWHMRDWLNNDKTLPNITMAYLDKAFFETYPRMPMAVCGAYANTTKHADRRKPDQLRARPHEFFGWEWGTQVTIKIWREGKEPTVDDGVGMADAALSCWIEFFDRERIDWRSPLADAAT